MRIEYVLRYLGRAAMYAVVGCVVTGPLSGLAATSTVDVANFQFTPPATTIAVNDTVHWVWVSGFHNTTSEPGDTTMWVSPNQTGPGPIFDWTFPAAGVFPYLCTIHGFTGTITVQGGNNPPSVSITSPTNGSTFIAPWSGTIQAAASDSDGTVTNVNFLAGMTLLGSVANPTATPSLPVTNLAAGAYTLTAVATDNGGAATTSTGVNINVVTPVAIVLSSPQRLSATSFQFSYTANPGLSYVVFRSGSLLSLSPISTNMAASGTATYLDTSAIGDTSYYSVHLLPNP